MTIFWIIAAIRNERKLLNLIIIRICVFVALLFLLLQPKFSWQDHYEYPLKWNIYVDRSVSMGYHQSISPNSYIENIRAFFASAMKSDHETSNYYFDHEIYEQNDKSFILDGEATDLSKIIDHIYETETELSGAIIISDGQITKGEQKQDNLKDLSIPIYTVGIGDTIPLVDVAVQTIKAPTVVVKGEDVKIDVTLVSLGKIDERINTLLYSNNILLGSKYIQIEGDGSLTNVSFRFTPETLGKIEYSVKTSVLADEVNINNNNQPFTITVLKDNYKIALITGSPNFNTGPLKKIIKNIPRIELDHYIQQGEKFYPSINEFWSKPYELIVFDNFPIKPISKRWRQILAKKIVSQKSSLFMVAGPNISDKSGASIYPFFHVQTNENIIDENKSKQWYWSDEGNIIKHFDSYQIDLNKDLNIFPPLYPKIFLETGENIFSLAYFDNTSIPLLVYGEVDGLRSGIWTSSDFATLYYKMTETEYENFSMSLINELFSWFMHTNGENELYFRTNKNVFQQGEEIHVVGSHFDQDTRDVLSLNGYINLINDQNSSTTYELNYNPVDEQWETKFLAGKHGLYTYQIILENENNYYYQNGSIKVDESQIELNQVSLNKEILQYLSDLTNGEYYSWESRAELLKKISLEHKQEIVVRNARLNENIIGLFILILFISIEWYIRRQLGLS